MLIKSFAHSRRDWSWRVADVAWAAALFYQLPRPCQIIAIEYVAKRQVHD